MNKREMKKVILGQLASYLKHEVIIDGCFSDKDITLADDVQQELAKEFERRSAGAKYSTDWN